MENNREYRNKQYVGNILDCIERIEKYLTGITREKFLDSRNDMMQAAVVRELEIIGEAVKRLSQKFLESHPDVAWHEIASMRNKIVHDYDSVDLVVVWDTTQEDIPPLKKALEKQGA